MPESPSLGAKVRAVRRRANLTQAQVAQRLGISASYLNLIEHGRRSLSAPLLIKLAEILPLDLKTLSVDSDARLAADLLELFADPLFEGHELTAPEVKDLSAHAPAVARATLTLYRAYRSARESAATLAMRLSEGDELSGIDHSRLPNEEVGDLIQRQGNYFPEIGRAHV